VTGRLKLSKSGAIAAIIAGDLILLVLGWFMLVGPERARAKSTERSAVATEVQIQQASSPAATHVAPTVQPKQPEIRTAYLYKLSKAMPMTTDMPNLLLELNQVVRDSGVQLASISPSAADASGTSTITLAVSGDFYALTDLLYRLRGLVSVHNGGLDVSGRLFAIKSVGLTPTGTDRQLNASIALNAFTFGAASAPVTPAAPAAPAPTDTSSTATTTTTGAAADSAVKP
jgi:type IV pilus assembly PilO-like protein